MEFKAPNFFILATSVLIVFMGDVLGADSSASIINDRKKFMKVSEQKMSIIKKNIELSNYQQAQENALYIKDWADKMKTFFPIGSEASISNLSAASSDIWDNYNVFKELIKSYQESANKIVNAAKNRDKDRLLVAFEATLKSCNSCHDLFRD